MAARSKLKALAKEHPKAKQDLYKFFEKSSVDPRPSMGKRIDHYRTIYVDKVTRKNPGLSKEECEKRYQHVCYLYHRVLLMMLQSETARRGSRADFSSLLNDEVFNLSMLACCAEVVSMHDYTRGLIFPFFIQEVFEVTPYHFLKIIENYIRTDNTLTRAQIKHLGAIEERILESMAWVPGSSLFKNLHNYEKQNGGCWPKSDVNPNFGASSSSNSQDGEGTSSTRSGKGNQNKDASMGDSAHQNKDTPMEDGAHQRVPESAIDGNGQISSRVERMSLQLFFHKFYYQASVRIKDLCMKLGVASPQIMNRVWTTFEKSITNGQGLMKRRHMDQLIMCSLYAACKISGIELTFKKIIIKYRTQPQSDASVFREVVVKVVDETPTKSTIIGFYNESYVPQMKGFVTQLGDAENLAVPEREIPQYVPEVQMSPRKVADGQNFYVSPYRKNRAGSMTPMTQKLYYFGEDNFGVNHNSDEIEDINKRINCVQNTTKKGRKIDFSADGEHDTRRVCLRQSVFTAKRAFL